MRQRATVLERLDGTLVLRTHQHGHVNLSTDGQRLWVEVEGGRGSSGRVTRIGLDVICEVR